MPRFDLRPYPDIPEGHWLRRHALALHAKGYTDVELIEPEPLASAFALARIEYVSGPDRLILRVHPAITAVRAEEIEPGVWAYVPDGWDELTFWADDARLADWIAALPDVGEVRRRVLAQPSPRDSGPGWPPGYEAGLRAWVAANGWNWDELARRRPV